MSARGFTLLEIMIVIAILGVLVSALFPAYVAYIERGRDATRITDIDGLSKMLNLFYSEREDYPFASAAGCVDQASLTNYGTVPLDPIPTRNNGCSANGQYGYGMSTGIAIATPDEFSLIAIMEQDFAGNFSGNLVGFTGTLTQNAYLSGTSPTYVQKGAWDRYVRIP